MAEPEQGMVREIAWKGIFPWWILVRCFRLAINAPVLALMAVGITLTVIGWGLFGLVLSPNPAWLIGSERGCPWLEILAPVPERMGVLPCPIWPSVPSMAEPGRRSSENVSSLLREKSAEKLSGVQGTETEAGTWSSEPSGGRSSLPSAGGFNWFRPLGAVLTASGSFRDWLYLVLSWLWKLAVWAFFGGAVTRIAVVRLAVEERLPLSKALQFARQKWPSYFAAPLFPFLGMILAGLPIAILGLFLKFDVGVLIAGLFWPLALLAGTMIMILLVGLLFGWPLMWTTISAEGTDCFDALSRSYAYVFQRPLRYLFYALIAALLGALGWILVSQFAAGVIQLTYWWAGWGYGGNAADLVNQTAPGPISGIGKVLIRFWVACVKLAAISYLAAYFWVAASAIYLLLRYDVDATEMDEVYLEEEAEQPGYGMPPLKPEASAAGATGPVGPLGPTSPPGAGPEPTGPAAAPNPQE
ncbi:MAG: hypothetical protein NZ602_14110 [Thermoguttaceae bacterium]|nr:hypothetical protein [Thermoguttaceae bacterium]MDW8036963.1 hypothetical protein [Thermoguttaceae bacterium]